MQILNMILNSFGITLNDVFSSLATLLLIFVFTLIGSYLHEVYCIIKDKCDKIEINKIIITCVTATIVLFLFSDKIILLMGYKGFIFVCFAAGAGGYKYVYRFYNGEILTMLLKRLGVTVTKETKDEDVNEDNNDKGEEN